MSRILNCKNLFNLFLINSKICDRRLYVCGQYVQKHLIYGNNNREYSTYVSALKLILKKKCLNKWKVKSTKSTSEKLIFNKKKIDMKFAELVKVSNNKSKETKMTVEKIKAKDVTAFAEEPGLTFKNKSRCIYNSTRSYDPDLMDCPTRVDYKINENSVQEKQIKQENKLIKKHVNNESHLNENMTTLRLTEKHHFHGNIKESLNFKKSRVRKASKKEEKLEGGVIDSDLLNVLPLSPLEIFQMPQQIQHDISRKSAIAVKKLSVPKIEEINVPLQEEKPSILESNIEEEKIEINEGFNSDEYLEDISTEGSSSYDLLLAYVDVVVHNKMPQNALLLLSKNRGSEDGKHETLRQAFNILLHSYSLKGNWIIVSNILKMMKLKEIKFNCQTYAAILDCLARTKIGFQTEELWKEEVTKHLKNMCKDKFSLNDLFTKTNLILNKHEKILNVVREILPFFEIEPTKMNLNSQCSLLKNLYTGSNNLESPVGDKFSVDMMEELIKEQLLIEQNFIVKVDSICKPHVSPSEEEKKNFDEINKKWRKSIEERFLKNLEMAELMEKKSPKKICLYAFLKCLPVSDYVDEMMDCVRNLASLGPGYSPSSCSLYYSLGDKIFGRYQAKKKIDLNISDVLEKLFLKYCTWYIDPTGPAKNSRQQWQMLIQEFQDGRRLELDDIVWPKILKHRLGKYLYDIIIKEVKTEIGRNKKVCPAFYFLLKCREEKLRNEIKCHPSVTKLFEKFAMSTLYFEACQIPMVCPPKPWKSAFDGGYLLLKTDFIRPTKEFHSKKIDLRKVFSDKLYATLDSLNSLQAVPWMINENVLNVALEVFRKGDPYGLQVPQHPDTKPILKNFSPELSPYEKYLEHKRVERIRIERQNQYSLWCEALYKLSLANHFKKRVFWLPQNFDFRGRVYPVPPHLNHLGADFFRSLLIFAKGKPLGDKGLDWLKIHTINLTGTHKKNSVSERLKYANQMLPEILDSAENPLGGRKWWMKSEDPWQTLAACMEIKSAVSSSDPSSYVSKLPVHQDGSCNGLQHYAALGKDLKGAASVNLTPNDVPQDVYNEVVEIIESIRRRDAENGVEIAKALEGFVRRKVVKQTIMTTVYGVTFFGAKKQISKQLEGGLKDYEDFPKQQIPIAAKYLVEKTFESLKLMFTAAKETQDWFTKCAEIICRKGKYVQWESPLGLPILQPYAKTVNKKKRQGLESKMSPLLNKQRNAFPPNFIHSLDSCHMMLTALFCEQQGLTFASIHDCFWTHPCSVDVMNKICREQFVSLHSLPILQTLSQYFIRKYTKGNYTEDIDSEALKIFESLPKTGSFDLLDILKSVYFFS